MGKLLSVEIETGNYSGFQIAKSEKLLIINEVRDFFRDGYCAFPIRRGMKVTQIIPSHVYYRGVRLHKIAPLQPKLNLRNVTLQTLLLWLCENKKMVAIELRAKNETDFFLGRLIKVHKSLVIGSFYQTGGKFRKPEKLRLSKMVRVAWDDRYLETMGRLSRNDRAWEGADL